MLWKLSLTGIKGRLRDYIVLFSGLVMTSAIFYMFESIASNEAFLESNSTVGSTVLIFHFGSVLLAIITFVYILYANSFLMAMRQKDYAMFMMLGAKGRKIAQMIFTETFVVGATATVVGSAIGVGLTSIVERILVEQLNISITHFTPFSVKGILITLFFFAVLFLLAAITNAFSIVKKPILTLIRAEATPTRMKQNKFLFLLEVVLGVVLLGVGYYVLSEIARIGLSGLGISLVTICLGTYFIFHSVIIFFLSLLKKSEGISLKKLNNFTLSQLSFRIRDYTQMLSMVAILFALALGALTVGLGFRNQISALTNSSNAYDLVLNNAQKIDQGKVRELNPTSNNIYAQKEDEQYVYYNYDEWEKEPLRYIAYSGNTFADNKVKTATAEEIANSSDLQETLRQNELPTQQAKGIKLVRASEFDQVNPELKDYQAMSGQKYEMYQQVNGIFSGMEFMGFFLGIAFLAMLASCLMFKILSGSKSDIGRYTMLEKIGATRGLLRQSIRREIGVLFLAPGILGAIHVLFGLRLFEFLMNDPYRDVLIPFGIFFVMYFIYYVLTVWLYTSIVLKREK